MNLKTYVRIIFTIFISLLEYLVGGFDNGIKTLLIFMFTDVITGFMKAYVGKSEKSLNGHLKSYVMWKGGIKKALIIIVIYISNMAESLISPDSQILRNLTVSYYIAMEALSILENIASCGISFPKSLEKALEQLKDQ
ncbi:MAG: phage holin family protein [Eubacterium sp.]|nr:phage holin family protein [Eubacterium sp.]